MNKKHSFIMAAIAMLAVGCQKETDTVTLGAEIQSTSNSKVYINDHTPCWHNGDEVYINNAAYPVMAASGATARIEDVVSADAYRAIFPASIVSASNDISNSNSIPVTLPSTQHYELVGGRQRVDVPMGAYLTSGSTLQFYNLCSIVRVIVSNSLNEALPLRSIVLQAEDAMLSGEGIATVDGQSSNSITLSNTAHHDVSLGFTNDCPVTVEALGTSTFDIVVPAFDANDVIVKVYTTDGQCYNVTKENVALAHNTITTVTLNVTELTEAPHAELESGVMFREWLVDGAPYSVIGHPDMDGGPTRVGADISVVFEYNSSVSSGILLSTTNSPVPIYGNWDGTVFRVSTSAGVIDANRDYRDMFHTDYVFLYHWIFPTVVMIDFGHGFNTSNVEYMGWMFQGCRGLTSLDVSNFNTSNVTDMKGMFDDCVGLTSLDVSNFNTSNVTDMSLMFQNCSGLTSLDVSNFNTSNVTDMSDMFFYCRDLTSLDLSNFNTSNVTDMSLMFCDCSGLTSLDVSNFNTSNVRYKCEIYKLYVWWLQRLDKP